MVAEAEITLLTKTGCYSIISLTVWDKTYQILHDSTCKGKVAIMFDDGISKLLTVLLEHTYHFLKMLSRCSSVSNLND